MITLITGIIGILTALGIMILIRKDQLHVRYGLSWVAVAITFAMLGLFPQVFDYLATNLGVAYPPILALTLGFSVFVIKILIMDIERSGNVIKLQRLVQRIALLETEIKEMQNTNERKTMEGESAEEPATK